MNYSRFPVWIGVILLFALLLCLPLINWHSVQIKYQTISIAGSVRSYRIVIPDELTPVPPLVFAFHGKGDSVDSMATYSKLDAMAAQNKFLLVYPSAKNAEWTINPDLKTVNTDIQFFDGLLDKISAEFEIDEACIYAVGMSHGASFAQLLAHIRSEVKAVVAHSGPNPVRKGHSVQQFPILMLVGAEDFFSGSIKSDVQNYLNRGHNARLIIVDGLDHEWSNVHNDQIATFINEH